RQDLGEVHRPHAGALAAKRAADVHQARVVRRRAHLRLRVEDPPQLVGERSGRSLSESIASEVSAFLTANVPPKPQHSVASGRSTRSIPRTASSSRRGRSPTCSSRSEWHVGCSVTRCGNEAPTSVTPSRSTRNSVSSNSRPSDDGTCSRTYPTHDADGDTTTSNPSNT